MIRYALRSHNTLPIDTEVPLTRCGLVTPYGERDLGQNWLW